MISAVSCVSSSTPASLSPTTNRQSPAGAAGQKANLIRVLKATVKDPGAAPSTRLINGLRRPRTSGVSGQPPRFSPRNGRLPQGGTAAYQALIRKSTTSGQAAAPGAVQRSRVQAVGCAPTQAAGCRVTL